MSFLKGVEKYLILPLIGALIGTFVQLVFYPSGGSSYRPAIFYPILDVPEKNAGSRLGSPSRSYAASTQLPEQSDATDSSMTTKRTRLPMSTAETPWPDTLLAVGVVATITWLFWLGLSR